MRATRDIAIIGGGVMGCAVARALARYRLDIVLLEKGPDVAWGTSRANSAVVHAGYLNPPGSMKAKLCVKGNRAFEEFARELGVPFRRTGKLVVSSEGLAELERLKRQGERNSVPGLSMVSGEDIRRLEPNIVASHGMLSASSAITNPYLLTIALAENATANGVEIRLNSEVTGIDVTERTGEFRITIPGGEAIHAGNIINCAGLHSDSISGMAGDTSHEIFPCRGEYFVLDKAYSHLISRMIYPVPPKERGVVGVHLTPTMEGNILIGPTAEFLDDRDDVATTRPMMDVLLREARSLLPSLPGGSVIQSFSGIRSKNVDEQGGGLGDFVIEESGRVPGLINLVGIESPGLTCSPVIPELVADLLRSSIRLVEREDYNPRRLPREKFSEMDVSGRESLVASHPDHGRVVCRCEHVTKREIAEALDGPVGASTVHGVKMRTRATSGRCHGGFCLPRIVEIMEEKGMDATEVTFKGKDSKLFTGRVR
jgi:glycerol-3-phosphate dehydrogenase